MKCPHCNCTGYHTGTACHSCGKGAAVREPREDERLRHRGGGEPRRYPRLDK